MVIWVVVVVLDVMPVVVVLDVMPVVVVLDVVPVVVVLDVMPVVVVLEVVPAVVVPVVPEPVLVKVEVVPEPELVRVEVVPEPELVKVEAVPEPELVNVSPDPVPDPVIVVPPDVVPELVIVVLPEPSLPLESELSGSPAPPEAASSSPHLVRKKSANAAAPVVTVRVRLRVMLGHQYTVMGLLASRLRDRWLTTGSGAVFQPAVRGGACGMRNSDLPGISRKYSTPPKAVFPR